MNEKFDQKSQTVGDFEKKLDSIGTGPHRKTPQEMLQDPITFINETEDETQEHQHSLDEAGQGIDPGKEKVKKSPDAVGEGSGSHDWSINDNDSKNGPVR